MLVTPQGGIIEQTIRLGFKGSNNEVKYKAIVHGLCKAINLGSLHIVVYYDSRMIANHLKREYEAKDPRMISYINKTKSLLQQFESASTDQLLRNGNIHANALATLASSINTALKRMIEVEYID